MPVVGVAEAVALVDVAVADPDAEDAPDGTWDDGEEFSLPEEAASVLLSLFRVRLEIISSARFFLSTFDLPDTKTNTKADSNNQQSCQSRP